MVFWTWAKGLEDRFDGVNRRSLRHFISKEITEKINYSPVMRRLALGDATPQEDTIVETPYEDVGVTTAVEQDNLESEPHFLEETKLYLSVGERKTLLPRMSTMAIFHKLSSGKGVPHTFSGFLEQWPALPRVVVFLSVRIMPVAHVRKENQYRVTKVRSLPGTLSSSFFSTKSLIGNSRLLRRHVHARFPRQIQRRLTCALGAHPHSRTPRDRIAKGRG